MPSRFFASSPITKAITATDRELSLIHICMMMLPEKLLIRLPGLWGCLILVVRRSPVLLSMEIANSSIFPVPGWKEPMILALAA